jgi:acyl dehydratase
MPQAVIDEPMLESMRARAGQQLRIDHSVQNDVASRITIAKFAGGIGDINPLWTDAEHATNSPYGGPVAPPSFVIGCFSGIQFGWPGLGSFHSESHCVFDRPCTATTRFTPAWSTRASTARRPVRSRVGR